MFCHQNLLKNHGSENSKQKGGIKHNILFIGIFMSLISTFKNLIIKSFPIIQKGKIYDNFDVVEGDDWYQETAKMLWGALIRPFSLITEPRFLRISDYLY